MGNSTSRPEKPNSRMGDEEVELPDMLKHHPTANFKKNILKYKKTWPNPTEKEMKDAIFDYKREYVGEICYYKRANQALREDRDEYQPTDIAPFIYLCREYLRTDPENQAGLSYGPHVGYEGIVWRGFTVKRGKFGALKSAYQSQIGESMVWKQFVSTSTDPEVARRFGYAYPENDEESVIFQIQVDKPTNLQHPCYAPCALENMSASESEVLFPPNVAIEILEVTTVGNWYQTKLNDFINETSPGCTWFLKLPEESKVPEEWYPGKPQSGALLIRGKVKGYDTDDGIRDANNQPVVGASISYPLPEA